LLCHDREPSSQAIPPHRVQPLQHVSAGGFALTLEEGRQFGQGIGAEVFGTEGHIGIAERHGRQVLQLHVEVAHGAEQPGQPPELLAEHLRPNGQYDLEQ
jgi:hypothetical protein